MTVTESLVLSALRHRIRSTGETIVLVTHKHNVLEQCDKLIHLTSNGQIAEDAAVGDIGASAIGNCVSK